MTRRAFRADHCGSFIRPEKLRKARVDRLHDRIDDAALAAIEDEAILDVLKLQRDAGVEIYSDGEFTASRIAASTTRAIRYCAARTCRTTASSSRRFRWWWIG
jgi:methionine synthase II (cobalamin-independent)